MPITIELADDHAILRQGLRRILEDHPNLAVVAEAASGIEAVEMAAEHKPDVALVDVGMKELNGIEATAQILRRSPGTAVLILSMYSDERYVVRAVRAGARGYLLKDSVEADLVKAIEQAHAGKSFFSPEVAKLLTNSYAREREAEHADDRYELLT
jgi:DNA-binding NarL/FixJ family response regulator